jgi:predicted secreted hydrolase
MRIRLVVILLLAMAPGFCAVSARAEAPLGIPVPADPTASDVLANTARSGDVDGVVPLARACASAPHRTVALPADDATHSGTYYEYLWWFGHAITRDGRRLAFMVILYSKPWMGLQELQYAITDLSTGTLRQAVEPVIPARPNAVAPGVDVRGDHAFVAGADGSDRLGLEVDGYRLDLSLTQRKPPALHYGDGHINGYCQDGYTYSRPRLRIAGTLRRDGVTVPVRGTAAYEHTWAFVAVAPAVNWVHMNFELRDGRDIMLFVVRVLGSVEKVASVYTGWISDPQGKVTTLHRGDFTLTPMRRWHRDATCSYPVQWDVNVKGLRLHVSAAIDADELRAMASPLSLALWPEFPAVWDGPSVVTGDAAGRGWNDLGHPCWA